MDVLKNTLYKDTNQLSRYSIFPYYYHSLDDKYIYGKTAYLRDTTLHTVHIVQRGETLDSLALEYYNNPTLYWIIASFNRIQDPFIELETGSRLKIPSISNIEFDV